MKDVLRGPGQPLDRTARMLAEPRFGHDFSRVRVHAGARAAESARAIDARAYTVGRNIVFGSDPEAAAPDELSPLLAHELTHVVQQHGEEPDLNHLTLGSLDDPSEREAELNARPATRRGPRGAIRRAPLFTSTLEVCKTLLRSRVFHLSGGGLSVTANASWTGSEDWAGDKPPDCGANTYNISLSKVGTIFDTHLPSREYKGGQPFTRTWGSQPAGDYYLTIWTNNTNPTCCLKGEITVSETAKAAPADKDAKKVCGPDVTQWLIGEIATNAKSDVVKSMKKRNSEDAKGVDAGALNDWSLLVQTGGPWDYKKDLGDAINLAPCRQNCDGKVFSVTLDGQCMTYEAPANIHFGYVGRAAGFSEEMLLFGASLAQVFEFRAEAKDDPRDVDAIRKGFQLFNAGSPAGLNKSGLTSNFYQNLPKGDGDAAGCEPCSKKL